MVRMEFGYSPPISNTSVDDFSRRRYLADLEGALDVASHGFDSAWVSDHLMFDDSYLLECWTMSTWIAARYPHLKVGQTVLCNSFRHPTLVAKMAATLQEISGGRLILGYGAGWHEPEYDAYGFDFPIPKVRIGMLEEAVQVMHAMWTESPASFSGDHYQVTDAYCEPRPDPMPTLMIGGKGEQLTMRVAARHGDWWNISSPDLETAEHKLNVLRRHCEREGRDYDSIRKTFTAHAVVDRSNARAQETAAAQTGPVESLFVGDPSAIRDQIEPYAALGYDYCMLSIAEFGDTGRIKLFADEVVPHFG